MLILLLTLTSAYAQDGLDGHHFQPIPGWGQPLDLIETWRAEAQRPRSFGFQGVFDASSGSLVQVYEDWNGVTETPLLDNVVALNLGVRAALSQRLALTATGPLYLASTGLDGAQGAGLGDIRVAAPVGILLPEGRGLAVGLVPMVDLPTGDATKLLGSNGVGAGALAAVGWHAPRATVDLNLGLGHQPQIAFENHVGGNRLLGSLGAGYALTEGLGVRAEAIYERALSENVVPGTDSPGEALLSLRGHHGQGLSWTAGGGAGFTEGAAAPAWRAFAGVGWAYIDNPDRDVDADGIVDRLDGCVRDPETKNAYNDEDGCPDALADLTLIVQDPEGKRLGGAQVTIDGQILLTEADGTLALRQRTPTTALSASVVSPGYVDGQIRADSLKEGDNQQTLTLAWLPGTLRVVAKDTSGKPIPASVALEGPAPHDPLALGESGRAQLVLPPGAWKLLATAEGFGTEGKAVVLASDKAELTLVEFTLKPPMVDVQKKEVVISEAVLFDFNAATLRPDAEPILRQVAGVLLEHPELKRVEIQGHTDDKGDAAYNLELSQQRVETVRTWLIANGIAADRLVAKGYGESSPIRSNATEAGQAANRRVQFMILEQGK